MMVVGRGGHFCLPIQKHAATALVCGATEQNVQEVHVWIVQKDGWSRRVFGWLGSLVVFQQESAQERQQCPMR